MFLGRRKPYPGSLLSPSSWRETLAKGVVQLYGGTSRRQGSQNTLPEANAARPDPQRKKNGKHPLLGRVCLLTTGGLMRVRRGCGQGYGWRRISVPIPSPAWRRRIISRDNGRFRLST